MSVLADLLTCVRQVSVVLEGLEREYRRDEDWCSTEKTANAADNAVLIASLIQKHQDQKVHTAGRSDGARLPGWFQLNVMYIVDS